MLAFACPNCRCKLRARDSMAGKKVHCPGCRTVVRIPAPTPLPEAPGATVQHRAPDRTPRPASWLRLPGYEVLGELGRGGLGVVYKARQQLLDRVVAIKVVLLSPDEYPDSLSRFEKEAVAVARLRHPNIVTAFDSGRHEGRLFLVMELLEGEDLDRRLSRDG